MSGEEAPPREAVPPGSLPARDLEKLALQVNGLVAVAQALADAFNILAPQARSAFRELEAAKAELARLRKAAEKVGVSRYPPPSPVLKVTPEKKGT